MIEKVGTGTNLNHQLLIVSVIQLFCSSDAQYWPALIGCLAAICNVIGWGLVGPGGRAQPRMEPCTSGHRDTNKVARVRDIFDFQCWLRYDSYLSDNIFMSVWAFNLLNCYGWCFRPFERCGWLWGGGPMHNIVRLTLLVPFWDFGGTLGLEIWMNTGHGIANCCSMFVSMFFLSFILSIHHILN